MFTAPNSNVAIICESADAAQQAKRFSAQLAAKHPTLCHLHQSLWNFRDLGKREIRNAAASAAASADLVIFAMSGIMPLPTPVVNWVELWLWLIDLRKPALAALFATRHPENARVRAYLRRGAASKGIAFLSYTDCAITDIDHQAGIPARAQNGINRATADPVQMPRIAA